MGFFFSFGDIYTEKAPKIMTNEEITEEIYHKAFEKGFIDDLRKKLDEFKKSNEHQRLSHHEMVCKAYYIVKSQRTNQDSQIFI